MSRGWSRSCARRARSCMRWRSAVSSSIGELVAELPPLLASHLALVLAALGVALAIGIPLAIALARRPRLAGPVLTAAGAIQTVPGLALLALMVPLLAAS